VPGDDRVTVSISAVRRQSFEAASAGYVPIYRMMKAVSPPSSTKTLLDRLGRWTLGG
jgi:hypothetical protein